MNPPPPVTSALPVLDIRATLAQSYSSHREGGRLASVALAILTAR